MQNAIDTLANVPALGREVHVRGFREPVRVSQEGALLLFYAARGGTLWIHRVRHAHQRPLTC